MPAKVDLPKVPDSLVDVSFVDAKTSAAAAAMSVAWFLGQVQKGLAPQPAIKAHMCTRWRLSDIRAWLQQRAQKVEA